MKTGEVFTPQNIVNKMLDIIDYSGSKIRNKKIIDNSAGQGAFLLEVVERYITEYIKEHQSVEGIESELERNIRGIEINMNNYNILLDRLNEKVRTFNIEKEIKWNIVNDDTLDCYDNFLGNDYVVGNPPYIRIHHLNETIKKKLNFNVHGMYDMYLIFYEIGMQMLNEKGCLIYITPNSFFSSKSGSQLRKKLISEKSLHKVINLGHYNPFDVSTYTTIVLLNKFGSNSVEYSTMNDEANLKKIIYKNDEYYIDNRFYFVDLQDLELLNKMTSITEGKYSVKNGVATNRDAFFHKSRSLKIKNIVRSFKISTGEAGTSFFPYNESGNRIPYKNIGASIKKELVKHKAELSSRSLQSQKWYEYARTQGIKDTFKKRCVVNNIIKDVNDLKINFIEEGVVVYSGYYIVIESIEEFHSIKKILVNENFIKYVKMLNKEKNGEYYFFSSKDLEKYLNYYVLNSRYLGGQNGK